MRMKKLKGIAVVSIAALLLSACSGSGKESNTRKDDVNINLEDKVDDMISVDKAEKSEYVRFNVTDVISVNKLKGYAEDENGNQIGPEKTINMIGLGDKGNLFYAGKILSTKWIGNKKNICEQFGSVSWIEYMDRYYYVGCKKVDDVTINKIKNNHDLWFERADMSKSLMDSTELDGYLWLTMPNEGVDGEHVHNTYNYQMIQSQFAQYDNSKIADKYKERFDKVYNGEKLELMELFISDPSMYEFYSKKSKAQQFGVTYNYDNEVKETCVNYILDASAYYEDLELLKDKYIKLNSSIYGEVSVDEDDGELKSTSIYFWIKDDVSDNYEDFMNYNLIGLYLKECNPDISDFYTHDSSYGKYILRYFNGY